jgi:hypothetical protein
MQAYHQVDSYFIANTMLNIVKFEISNHSSLRFKLEFKLYLW